MSEERVTIHIEDGVADVRFNRPDKMNALDSEQFAAILAAGERLKAEKGVRCVNTKNKHGFFLSRDSVRLF